MTVRLTLVDGPPDWIAEVLSPSTRQSDETDKLEEYAKAGVAEYWLVDIDEKSIGVYQLDEGRYTLVGTFTSGQTVHAQTIAGFEIAVDDVI